MRSCNCDYSGRRLPGLLFFALVLASAGATAQPAPKPLPSLPDMQVSIGTPQRSTPMNDPIIFYLQLRDPNTPSRGRSQKVSVDYVKSGQMMGEDNFTYAARLTREKAKAYADATNGAAPNTAKVIEKEVEVIIGWQTDQFGRPLIDRNRQFIPIKKKFKQGYVEFTNLVNDPKLMMNEQLRGQQYVQGERVKQPNGSFKVTGANPTGEPGGGGIGFGATPGIPPPQSTSPGKSMGSMGGASGLSNGISIGDFPGNSALGAYAAFGRYNIDTDGNPITDTDGGLPVAVVNIRPGETGTEVLQELLSLLTSMGVDAFYDSAEDQLILDNIGPNQAVFWNETDTGLEFDMGLSFIIPSPGTLPLFAIGVGLIAWVRRRRR